MISACQLDPGVAFISFGLMAITDIQQAQDIAQKVAAARENPAAEIGDNQHTNPSLGSSTLTPSNSNDGILRKLARDGHNELLDAIEATLTNAQMNKRQLTHQNATTR